MGLVLSILVACVCVAELIGFYAHVRRSLLGSDASDGDLETIALNYKGQLASKYRRILTTIYEEDRVETNYSLSTSPRIIFSSNANLMTSASDVRSPTTQKSGAPAKKEPPSRNECADVNHKGASCSSPEEHETRPIGSIDSSLSSITPYPTFQEKQAMGMHVEDDPPLTAKLDKITTDTTIDYDRNTSPSPSKLRLGDGGGGLAPPTTLFPAAGDLKLSEREERFVPAVLLQSEAIWDSLGAADGCLGAFEENFTPALRRRRRSRSFSPESDALQTGGNALRRVVSATQLVPEDYWRRSPSPFRSVLAGEDVIEQFRLVGAVFDDGFKDSLDGVNEERKREFRKKRKANRVMEVAESFVISNASEEEEEEVMATIAPPRSPSAKCEASTSGGGGGKKPEPFWVNRTNDEAGLK